MAGVKNVVVSVLLMLWTPVPVHNMAKEEHCGSSSLPDTLGKNHEGSSSGIHHNDDNRTSTKSIQQINGGRYESLRPQDSLGKNHESSSSGRRHDYHKPISANTAQQINGDLSKSHSDYGPKNNYNEPKAEGHSQQLNGDVRDPELFSLFLASRCQPEMPYEEAVSAF